jgi:peptidoglycan/LPS O-acetylase OafA/YrhL
MKISREWATPLAMGAFLLSAVTGVLIFFHLDSGLNKAAHEWLSWALLAGVALHVASNFQSFKKHISQRGAQAIVVAFMVILALSFMNVGGDDKPPFVKPVTALANAPLEVVATVANVTPDEVISRLSKAGYSATSGQQSIKDVVGADFGQQMRALNAVMSNE